MAKFITDQFREQMHADVTVNDINVDQFLLNHALTLSRYIAFFSKVSAEYKKIKKEYNELYSDKWAHFRFKYQYDTNDRDATKLADGDKDVTQKLYEFELLECEVKELQDYIDILKWKKQSIATWLEVQKFKAGM